MGNENTYLDEKPRHPVHLYGYFIEKKEVSIRDWFYVHDWAIENGYDFSENQSFPLMVYTLDQEKEYPDFPMNNVSWLDCLKWCNARSELMGRKPVYYTDSSLEDVFREGEFHHFTKSQIDFTASGFRLPTEAEWEKAAYGIVRSFPQSYPWGKVLNGSFANYKKSGDPFDDGITPVGYYNSKQIISSRTMSYGGENQFHSDMANALGLYDIIGNVSEWCWDWYSAEGYNRSKYSVSIDPHGPDFSEDESNIKQSDKSKWEKKVHRGGSYKSDPSDQNDFLKDDLKISSRGVEFHNVNRKTIGLRTVRRQLDDELWFDRKETRFHRWFISPWYGSFYQSDSIWVFHENHGWIYPVGKGAYDNWIFFNSKRKWLWTSKHAYPWHFNVTENVWIKDLSADGERGWFESLSDGTKTKWGYGF